MRLIFLGTGGTMPLGRALPALAVKRDGELLLFDSGEATQIQMIKAGLSLMKLKAIFLTHFHGDHFLGLAGLVQTMALGDREEKLEIYGPPGTERKIKDFLNIPCFTLTFEVAIRDLEPGSELKRHGYRIQTSRMEHTLPGLTYGLIEDPRAGKFNVEKALQLGLKPGPNFSKLQAGKSVRLQSGRTINPEEVLGPPRPGRKIVYANDTRPCEETIELARGADVLIHDCTLADELADKAIESGHSTPSQAAEVAKRASVDQLVLVHISPRYKDASVMLEQARKMFPNAIVAHDLMELKVKLKES